MTKCKVIALANQKGGTAKTTTTLNLGIGLAHQGRKVLLVDADPQGDLTTALGWINADSLPITLETQMKKILQDEPFVYNEGILHHEEGVDIIPTNIELSGMEISLVNAMSREQTLKLYLADLKKDYDYILIDCMPSLGMLTINALAAADSVSHAQAIKIRKFSAEGRLNEDVLLSIMAEEKPNQVEQWKIPKNRLKKYFPSGTSQQKMEETIIKALELYRKREKSRER